MADLYQVYANYGTLENFDNEDDDTTPSRRSGGQQANQYQAAQQQQPSVQQQAPPAPPTVQTAPPKQQVGSEKFTNMQASYKRSASDLTFWDKMSMKRPEVIKLAVFSLVIVLGISLDRIGTHYITKYISENIFTNFQEFMLRLSYPVVVFLVLWILKAL